MGRSSGIGTGCAVCCQLMSLTQFTGCRARRQVCSSRNRSGQEGVDLAELGPGARGDSSADSHVTSLCPGVRVRPSLLADCDTQGHTLDLRRTGKKHRDLARSPRPDSATAHSFPTQFERRYVATGPLLAGDDSMAYSSDAHARADRAWGPRIAPG